jgi:ribonuclease-3
LVPRADAEKEALAGLREHLEPLLAGTPLAGSLLEKALTHRSSLAHGQARSDSNEALEFLGDAVLDLVIADRALALCPHADEGTLTQVRAALVNTGSLADVARGIGLGGLLQLGEGERRTGGAEKQSLLAGACEALIAALYLTAGLPAAAAFIHSHLGERLASLLKSLPQEEIDPKSALQERLQAGGAPPPDYRVISSSGPDHRPSFQVQVWHGGRMLAEAEGESKKQAERRAARRALAGDGR